MPNLQSSKKDLRRTEKRTKYNDRIRNRVKRAIKTFNTHVVTGNIDKAKEALPKAVKVLGKAAQKKVFKKQNISRKISRLTKKLNNLITATNVETTKKSA